MPRMIESSSDDEIISVPSKKTASSEANDGNPNQPGRNENISDLGEYSWSSRNPNIARPIRSCGFQSESEESDPVIAPRRRHTDSKSRVYLSNETDSDSGVKSRNSQIPPRWIQVPPRTFPESCFVAERNDTEKLEAEVLATLLSLPGVQGNCFYQGEVTTSLDLNDFCIYWLPTANFKNGLPEFISLKDLYTKPSTTKFFLDGYLSVQGSSFFVRGVPFDNLSVGGFGDLEKPSVGEDIWVASLMSAPINVWYRLRTPVDAYKRFHDAFLWTANFCKLVIDYLDQHEHENEQATLDSFTSHFCAWLKSLHGQDPEIQSWYSAYGMENFKRAVAGCSEFLERQASDVGHKAHPLWDELRGESIKRQPMTESKTIVTPYVYSCFKDMWFGSAIISKPSKVKTSDPPYWSCTFGGIEEWISRSPMHEDTSRHHQVRIGDVVALEPDDKEVTPWKNDNMKTWYAYVHDIQEVGGTKYLGFLWIYASSHTTISTAFYPQANELFISDHCNCCDDSLPSTEEDVVGVVPVKFFARSPCQDMRFVRQQYHVTDQSFRTLAAEHFSCPRLRPEMPQYAIGSTVLARFSWSDLLEPVIVLSSPQDGRVNVRILPRLSKWSPDAAKNELVYSNDRERAIKASLIDFQCFVRVFGQESSIPEPYSCNGVGNYFYVRFSETEGTIKPLIGEVDFVQGPSPSHKSEVLSCLDLFSGCGNFGLGIEQGGAAKMRYSVEMEPWALHSYAANLSNPGEHEFFLGSVNDFLSKALDGKSKGIPSRNSVRLVIAGSPCQGFSIMNAHRNNTKSLTNVSLIASVVSFVDFYRPEYAILENVTSMTRTDKKSGQNAFSQILASLVGMGYQVQQFNCDASMEGAPQSRSRLFIVACAPGLNMLSHPGVSHRHHSPRNHHLGRAPNGEPFGARQLDGPRAFDFVSIGQATAKLPNNIDGRLPSIRYPDHRSIERSYHSQALIENVPRLGPRNAPAALLSEKTPDFIKEAHLSLMNNPERMDLHRSRSFKRLDPEGVIGAVTATFSEGDSRIGRLIHWNQNRPITIEEARIAQQFPEDFVLLGPPRMRWRLVGNSVPRGLSLALGLSLRQALDENRKRKEGKISHMMTVEASALNKTVSSTFNNKLEQVPTLSAKRKWQEQGEEADENLIWRAYLDHKPRNGVIPSTLTGDNVSLAISSPGAAEFEGSALSSKQPKGTDVRVMSLNQKTFTNKKTSESGASQAPNEQEVVDLTCEADSVVSDSVSQTGSDSLFIPIDEEFRGMLGLPSQASLASTSKAHTVVSLNTSVEEHDNVETNSEQNKSNDEIRIISWRKRNTWEPPV